MVITVTRNKIYLQCIQTPPPTLPFIVAAESKQSSPPSSFNSHSLILFLFQDSSSSTTLLLSTFPLPWLPFSKSKSKRPSSTFLEGFTVADTDLAFSSSCSRSSVTVARPSQDLHKMLVNVACLCIRELLFSIWLREIGHTIDWDGRNKAVEDIDWDALTVKGTCQEIEKRYLRLTSAPDPATVRPEEVLEKAILMVQNSQKNYIYKCDQLKSIRKDLIVQRIRNQLTAKVYETHARLALEFEDLPEYNQVIFYICLQWKAYHLVNTYVTTPKGSRDLYLHGRLGNRSYEAFSNNYTLLLPLGSSFNIRNNGVLFRCNRNRTLHVTPPDDARFFTYPCGDD
ncbi:SAC3 family protein A isoform X1 [Senna tora]|uniref:SAC3 family protein A isoform X1 n=1 Tax=Senna tora TaxID=362788 RepID=A0A834TLD3_9FABA|nr:SAC3 family protein A isoform X1 [Senna tora]